MESTVNYPGGARLLADIGGTNARFALETAPGVLGRIRVYRCADFPGVQEVVQRYVEDVRSGIGFSERTGAGACAQPRSPSHTQPGAQSGTQPDEGFGEQPGAVAHAAFAIANPVDGDHVAMTNHDWSFSIEATRHALGFDTLRVVNDFTALAMALPALDETQRRQVGGGAARSGSAIGLLGPGTGLGVSGLIPAGERWVALNSEGGHACFAPADAREDCILAFARTRWAHVSFERIVSGPGIELIYRALAAADPQRLAPGGDSADIVALALAGDALALETVDCFCGILGGFAGNLALTLGALGGVFIGGGVVEHFGELFQRSSFRRRFEAKGRFEAYLQRIPTFVITAPYPAFVGVGRILEEHLGSRSAAAVKR